MAEIRAESGMREELRPIPARVQLLAVAWLRWRIFVNGMFRRRGTAARQAAGLIFAILVRIIVWPFVVLMVVGPVVGSGFLAWQAIAEDHPQNLVSLLAGIALLWQFVSVNGMNIAAAVSNFDPSSLIRFPLRFGRYLILRTLFGLLTPSTIVGCLALMAAAAGIGFADPHLAVAAVIVLATYALMNIFLTRMIEAWLERWLANRRFREIFGVLMALLAISVQFMNFQNAPAHGRVVTHSWVMNLVRGPHAYLNWLPPGFAANSILFTGEPMARLAQFTGLLVSTLLVGSIFAIRLHKQFLGEYLSESGAGRAAKTASRARTHLEPRGEVAGSIRLEPESSAFPPVVGACLRKEWIIFRSNISQAIGLVTPLFFIVIFSRATFAQRPAYFLPGAIAYSLVGALAGLYNIFGADGLGVQIYLLAPVRLRDVIVAKNLASLALVVTEAGLAWILVSVLSRSAIPFSTQVATLLWLGFVITANLALGTLRSIQAPRKFVPGQARQRRATPTGRTSSLLILLVLFGSVVLQVPVLVLCRYFHQPWLAALIYGPLAGAAVFGYALVLRNADRLVLSHWEVLAEELCKA